MRGRPPSKAFRRFAASFFGVIVLPARLSWANRFLLILMTLLVLNAVPQAPPVRGPGSPSNRVRPKNQTRCGDSVAQDGPRRES